MIMFHIFQHKMSKRCNGGGKNEEKQPKMGKNDRFVPFLVIFFKI